MTLSRRSIQVSHPNDERRHLIRRDEDLALRLVQNQQTHKLQSLLEPRQPIGSDLRLEHLFSQIVPKSLGTDDVFRHEALPGWIRLYEKLGDFFNKYFGPDRQKKDEKFWKDFNEKMGY
jgi:hypothetical protein